MATWTASIRDLAEDPDRVQPPAVEAVGETRDAALAALGERIDADQVEVVGLLQTLAEHPHRDSVAWAGVHIAVTEA